MHRGKSGKRSIGAGPVDDDGIVFVGELTSVNAQLQGLENPE